VLIDKTFRLEDARGRCIEDREVFGKIIVAP
jgi:hypothetical protein